MKVLVIGGAGYIGSTLCPMLWQRGHEVTVLDLLMFGREPLDSLRDKPRFTLQEGDLRCEQTLAQIMPGHDAVVLLGAIVGEPACNRDEKAALETNLYGALKVLNAARTAGVQRFVFSSTCSNYGIADYDGLATEDSPLKPLSAYSESKVAAEAEILGAASDTFCPTVLRFSTAFGVAPRMRFDLLVSDFSLAAVRDKKIVIYGEQFWRPFVHVDDISDAVRLVLDSQADNVRGEVFNIGCNENNVQKQQLGEMVQQHIPGTELEFVKRGTDPRSYRVDFAKAAKELGFKPRWSVADGIQEVYAGLQDNRWPDPSDSRFYN